MFPGLGAEYPGMVDAFCTCYPWARTLISNWGDLINCDLLAENITTPKETENLRQLRIHALNLLWWRVVRPTAATEFVCCGHSLGFYAALVAAGALTEESSWRWVQMIFDEAWGEFANNDSKIAVITTTVPVAAHSLAAQFSVEIMAKNSAQQVVVYGTEQDIAKLCIALKGILLRYSDLDTRVPFHSISMWRVCDRLAVLATDLTVANPSQSVWSHLTGEILHSAVDIRTTLLEQPCRAVLWEQLIQSLWDRYSPEFVEVGPSRILSQLVRWNIPAAKVRYVDHLRRASTSNQERVA